MADMTDAVREALGGVTYGVRETPLLDTPQDDSPTVDTLVTDPVHCTARHLHHDFQSVVTSMMCGLIGQVPKFPITPSGGRSHTFINPRIYQLRAHVGKIGGTGKR